MNRRARRTKTDRIDACKLVTMLGRARAGERGVWREVRVPSDAAEAARQVSRERAALVEDRTRLTNQIGSWLAGWGCRISARERAVCGEGSGLRTGLMLPLMALILPIVR